MNKKTCPEQSQGAQEWHAITVSVPRDSSDWISHLLFELGSVGNLEEDGPDPMLVAMKGYFPTELGPSNAIIQSILELIQEKGIHPFSTYTTTLKIQNWAEAAQQMFAPIKILEDVTIISPWEKYMPSPGETVIVINPGMAFGTGLHATTQLAARMIAKGIKKGPLSSMCDVGCGSGILSIIARKKGIPKIKAVEIDEDARSSAQGNVSKNGCKENIKILENIDRAAGPFDLVAANILYSTIVELREELSAKTKNNGLLVLSGIMLDEDKKLINAFGEWKLLEREVEDGWVGYLFQKI